MRKLMEDITGRIFILLEPTICDEPLRKEFQRLRYSEFVAKKNRGWEPENEEKIERDLIDQRADYIVCISGGKDDCERRKIIAGCRLITNDTTELPISKAIKKIQPHSLEISRMISISKDPSIKCMLYALIYRYAVDREYKYVYALARRGIARIIRKEKMDIFIEIGDELPPNGNLRLIPMMTHISSIPSLVKNENFLLAI